MDQRIINDLESLHLSQNEAKVYVALLEIGQTSAGKIITKTRLHRSVVYETLDKLIGRKLAFKLQKNNITYFQATDPQRILENVKSEEEIAQDLVPKLRTLVDEKLPQITVYEGVKSYKRFWLDSVKRLPEGSTDCFAGSIGKKWWDYMGTDAKKYHEIRRKRKITWKNLTFSKEELDEADIKELRDHPEVNEFRLIKRLVPRDGNFNVFADESVILHSATEPMIIEVKNPTLVKVFQNIFDILWVMGEKI